MMKVNNLPAYARDYKYIVVRTFDGEDWFYGAWNDFDRAEAVAFEFDNGHVINSERVIGGY